MAAGARKLMPRMPGRITAPGMRCGALAEAGELLGGVLLAACLEIVRAVVDDRAQANE